MRGRHFFGMGKLKNSKISFKTQNGFLFSSKIDFFKKILTQASHVYHKQAQTNGRERIIS
jgi:hypothetical protein